MLVSGSATVSWGQFELQVPDLAEQIRTRFESHIHAVLGTLRSDGSPRLSGIEVPIRDGHLWLAMMSGSLKATDLHQDPRFSLHSSLDTEELLFGDARIDGQAVGATPEEVEVFVAGHRMPIDDPDAMVLFIACISRAVLTRVEGQELVIDTWTPSDGFREIRRI
ncbi:MAG: pyridoxamine 5'-phosphate oxidase family protein [Acidimicrobiia bacterium]|nr:pyridoxamine 5'-phosphate oxidase family protein [Acidimicrobiia bacterium]MYG94419.1 pyridoxamine 5'-phosphate oxidase family protein [Acidimicrobiia bacterium]MYI30059.1 pyridoxamine 5'-phosphate oxidase family protein [Acidimicrobiia bacterium]